MLCEIKIKIVGELISPSEKSLFLLYIEALVGVGKVSLFGTIDKEHLCACVPLELLLVSMQRAARSDGAIVILRGMRGKQSESEWGQDGKLPSVQKYCPMTMPCLSLLC